MPKYRSLAIVSRRITTEILQKFLNNDPAGSIPITSMKEPNVSYHSLDVRIDSTWNMCLSRARSEIFRIALFPPFYFILLLTLANLNSNWADIRSRERIGASPNLTKAPLRVVGLATENFLYPVYVSLLLAVAGNHFRATRAKKCVYAALLILWYIKLPTLGPWSFGQTSSTVETTCFLLIFETYVNIKSD